MKFDMGRAWNEATAMIAANRTVLLVIAAVFFFLPAVAFSLLVPGAMAMETLDPANPLAALGAMFFIGFLIYLIVTYIGTLAMLNLLSDRTRPTVGQAIGAGAKGFLPYFLAQILLFLGLGLLAAIIFGIAGAIGVVLMVLAALIVVPVLVWLYTKFSLTAAVIAVEHVYNPIKALARSWKLVSGNSLRLFAFYLVLLVTFIVVYIVLSLIIALPTALLGAEAALIATAILQGLLGMVFTILFIAIIAAVHSQLAGPNIREVQETFE